LLLLWSVSEAQELWLGFQGAVMLLMECTFSHGLFNNFLFLLIDGLWLSMLCAFVVTIAIGYATWHILSVVFSHYGTT
jgi:hypothetical protein